MARPVVGNPFENQIPTVSPTASPVETYVRPAVKKSPFETLANTLNNLERKASPIFEAERKRLAEKEFAEGQELYNKTRKSIGEAVKSGIIAEGESPYLRKGYRVANLNILSSKFATELELELSRKQLYKNGDPAAAEAFAAKFAEEFRQREGFDNFGSTEVAQYFLPAEQKTRSAFISSWKTKHVAWQREQNYLAFENEVATYTNDLFKPTDDYETKLKKTAQLQEWLTSRMSEAETDGMSRKRINDTIVNAVMVTAQEQLDTDVLNILDGLKTGTGTLGSALSVRSKSLSLTNQINNAIARQEADIAKTIEAERKATVKTAKNDLLNASLAIFNANPKDAEKAAALYDNALATLQANGEADAARTWINFSREMDKAGREDRKEDEIAAADLFADLQVVETRTEAIERITQEVARGTINFNTAQSAIGDVNRRFNNAETAPVIDYLKSGSLIKDEFSRFESTLESKDQFGNTGNQKFVNTVMGNIKEEYRNWLYSQETVPTEFQKLEETQRILARAQVLAIPLDEEIAVQQQFEDVAASRQPKPPEPPEPTPTERKGLLETLLGNWWTSNNGGSVPTPNN